MKIVLATSNPGKLKEIQAILKDLPVNVVAQSQLNVPDAEENGLSFVENALIKARHAALRTGLPALADDSGLVVDALGGEPGIHSARYAGLNATSEDNIQKLLQALATTPKEKRQARFYCVIVFVRSATDPMPLIAQGAWEGEILTQPIGEKGFGYDPIFWVPDRNVSAAQLDSATKNQLSHRGKALSAFLAQMAIAST